MPRAWAVNGFCSVIATTVVALILATSLGFTVILIAAALCHSGALVAVLRGEAAAIEVT